MEKEQVPGNRQSFLVTWPSNGKFHSGQEPLIISEVYLLLIFSSR